MFPELAIEANQIVQSLFGITDMPVEWQTPKEALHGDISTIVALKIARATNKKPQDVAAQIAEALTNSPSVAKAEVAGAGYINVWLKPAALITALTNTLDACSPKTVRKEDPVIVEYSGPNIAKPLGIHHIIGTVVGQSVSNLYEFAGYPVIRWNYMGDWGTQFGKLAVAIRKWGSDKKVADYTIDELLALYVKFHDELPAHPDMDDEARLEFKKLEEGDPVVRAFWEDVVSVTKASLSHLYGRLHVRFDVEHSESFYEDKMDTILEEGKKKKVFVPGEGGSLIVEFSEESNLPPFLVQKGDGATLYSTRDITQMKYRADTYHPQSILIFTDIAQKLHFEQVVATCAKMKWSLPHFENVLFGRMRFADKAMSTRKGNILKLEDALDEAVSRATDAIKERGDSIQTDDSKELAEIMGVGALVYGILSQNRKMDLVFDWDKMLSFEGNSAPYLQYTHARAKSVLRKSETGDQKVKVGGAVKELSTPERILIGTLLQFPRVLVEARSEHLPHKLANFLYQLCQDFNSFYNTENILNAEPAQRDLRLSLTSLTATVLKTGAELLTLRVPERM